MYGLGGCEQDTAHIASGSPLSLRGSYTQMSQLWRILQAFCNRSRHNDAGGAADRESGAQCNVTENVSRCETFIV